MKWKVPLLILCSFAGHLACADDMPPRAAIQPRPPANAATVYWQAFAALPTLEPDEHKQFDAARSATDSPIPASVAALIERFAPALKLMHRASEAKVCDWELDYSEGPMLLLPHLAKLRELAFAALLRAKLRFADHDGAGAMSDTLATLKMARHAANSPLLISVLVGASIEAPATDLLAEHLPQIERPTLQRLAGELTALPATPAVAVCLRVEGDSFVKWLETFLQVDPAGRQQPIVGRALVQKLNTVGIFSDLNEETRKQLAESLDTGEKLQAAIVFLRKTYAETARIAALEPYSARYEQLQRFDDDRAKSKAKPLAIEPERVLAMHAVPAIRRVVEREVERDVRRELLRLAVGAVLDGRSNLGAAPKLGGGEHELKFTASGFELRHRVAPGSPWEVLTVGHPNK
jgi:hypothetical protein